MLALTNLETIIIGGGSFKNVSSITFESIFEHILKLYIELALLTSIQLGELALRGNDVDYCSLKMQSNNFIYYSKIDLPNLQSLTSKGYSFYYPNSFTLKGFFI